MITIQGNWFKDEQGRTLLLRGVNLGGSSKIPLRPDGATWKKEGLLDHRHVSFVGRPFPLEAADEHFSRLKAWGLTFIRFLVTWEAIEHAGPGIYDLEYLDYVHAVIQRAADYDISVFIDPHQDVWSRFSGGDGAPGWTFEVAGLDISKLHPAGAAILHQIHGDPFPRMVWPSNVARLACATMFTLFFGGNDFAPLTQVEGEPVQDYLQGHYIGAFQQLAIRLADLPNVIGYDCINEPSAGWIGLEDLRRFPVSYKLGASPTPFQSISAGAGFPQEVEFWVLRPTGPKLAGKKMINEEKASVWLAGKDCIWKTHGVWEVRPAGIPRLLKPDYFHRKDGRPVNFELDYLRPFINRFATAIRQVDPKSLLFIESEQGHLPSAWRPGDVERFIYAPHWYDGVVLMLKDFWPWLGADAFEQKIVFGAGRIRRSFARQMETLKQAARGQLGGVPLLIGETGIPFDLKEGKAFRTGNFHAQVRAMDRTLRAMDDSLLSYTLWNYTPDNTNAHGDQWNGEDLSIFSRDQQRHPQDINSGGRALEAVVRPYARATAGEPLRMSFDINKRTFEFEFRHDPQVNAPTEFFIPDLQYPHGYQVEVSDGSVEKVQEKQALYYQPGGGREIQVIKIRPAK